MDNKMKYNEIFKTIFNVDENQLNESFTFKEVEVWDSIAHLSLITELEDTFNVMFETEDILSFGSYKNGIRILEKYGVSFNI
ncbi:hypothetical protein M670_01690 [Schinkia azotoformans MEV2011]|uniref:Uncharacterized protein n=1 Tax=Schinkia azotoformans MEV2011 TaxID=1348973 RepID=A0A072NMG4_SCHAZ|nr:acyl carrier protein [Schinkia azotoformans]KEF38874.1 hypothetical protein M670_01690 [Schinkia azotoformans MEV2011]MEC1696777.1 acyl carrier protein [Schinkia azotoformans]MEC1725014.1 acyl carrier protein [Schinkia azotoformans]MEC1741751.1 acyl carrier protein [Schinkia azotoformans]MEC1766571.1 acyl carrier protein [Schinkia azotoformans]